MTQTDTSREVALNLSEWIERRKADVGPYADHIVHSVRHYEAEVTRLREGRDQLQEQLAAANTVIAKEQGEVLHLRKTVKGLRAQTTRLMYDHEPRPDVKLPPMATPTSEQKVHENWPAPFHEGFWAIVDENGAIQEGAYGWAISPEGELEAWQRLVEPCDQSTVELAKERGRRAVFFPAANSLQKTQTIQEELSAARNDALEEAAKLADSYEIYPTADCVQRAESVTAAVIAMDIRDRAKEPSHD